MMDVAGKRVTVAGLGRFGGSITVARWLVEQGAKVLVTDKAKPEALKEAVEALAGLPIERRLGEHRNEDFTQADLVVASPAIAPHNEYLHAARDAGVPVTTEIRLFIERCPAPIFGVTGTKGKSTTTALLGLMLNQRRTTHVGGNIGKSLLLELPSIKPEDLVVLELSSFMLDYLADWSPHVAVVTMIAPDHIEWHGSFEAYKQAKMNLVRQQTSADYLIIGDVCAARDDFIAATRASVRLFGLENRRRFSLRLHGEHNQLNAQAAFAAASTAGVEWDEAQAAIASFPGLPHRMELVHEANGVRWYNDSIATIPEAAVAALDSFPRGKVIQIVGGYDKHLKLDVMVAGLVDRAKAVLCIGATGPAIAESLGQSLKVGSPEVFQCNDLETAVTMARQIATSGDIVLMSPGCASYGPFRNFEERGHRFAHLAREG